MTVAWAVGDGATGGTDAAKVAEVILADKPNAFLWLGDVYESGTLGEFQSNYAPSWGQLDSICLPIPGNHDWANYSTGYSVYFSSKGCVNAPFYYKDFGSWGVFMLNSEEPMAEGSPQYEWAQKTLSGTAKSGRKNLAAWHRPRYCSGSHGDAEDTDPLWQLLGPRCAVILGGHAHNMQHFNPDVTGCRQLVSGAGGRALYAEIPGDPRLTWGKADGYGAVRLELEDQLGVRWVDENGAVLYEAVISV